MGSYRFEQAPSNRSSCTNKECKDAKVKILKGELRLGSWIEGERFQGYTWRHWGCTTPKVIENIVTAWKDILPSEEPDYTMLDGYDELPEDLQLKIRTALTQGHVDDSDWKGDLEVNRPGKTGFRVRGGAKGKNAKDEKVATTEGSEANDDTVPADKPKPKRAARSKKAAVNEEPDASGTDETEQKPAANTKKSRAKKPATAADADAPPKKRGRPTKAAATETPAQPAKKGTKRKTSEEETHVSEPEKPKRARGKAGKTSTLPNDNESAPPTKAARGRKKAPKE